MAINGASITLPTIAPATPAKTASSLLTGAGAGQSSLSQLSVSPSMLSTPLKVTTPPVSPVTKSPVSTFGSAAPVNSGSIVDYLNGQGKASDYTSRAALAASNGISGYTGTADQNTQLLGLLRGGVGGTPTPSSPVKTAGGSTVSTDGSGNVTSPSGFSIDTSGPIDSSVLGSTFTAGDAQNQLKTYTDYVNGLSQAQQYSPEYLAALDANNKAKLQEAQINSNFYTGTDLPGDTLPYAQGATAKALQQNQLSQLSSAQQMQVQELVRQGNIGAATALVDAYKPTTVSPGSSLVSPADGSVAYGGAGAYSDYQAQQTYFNLAQNFPDAQIPSYNPALSAQQNLQVAQSAAAKSPSFQSRNLIQVTDSAGGVHFVQKNQLQTNPDGSYTFISPSQATSLGAASAAIKQLTTQKADTQAAISTADANFPLLIAAAQKAGVGVNTPLFINGVKQAAATQLGNQNYAAFQTLATSLQTEYARIVARGGTVDDNTRNSAKALLNGTYNINQLKSVYDTVQREGKNILSGFDDAINEQQKTLGAGTTTGGSGGLYDF